jgi:hypothetical protein
MPQIAIGAGMIAAGFGASAAAGTAALTGTAFGAFLGASSSVLYGLGASAVLGGVAQALGPKPSTGAGALSRKTVIQTSEPYWRFIYGRARTSLTLAAKMKHGNWNTFTSLVLLAAAHECDGFEKLYVGNDEVPLVTNGSTWGQFPSTALIPSGAVAAVKKKFWADGLPRFAIEPFLGGAGQVVSPYLASRNPDRWSSAHKLSGTSGIVFHFNYHPDITSNITDLSAVFRGKRILDPRSGSTVWTQNAALIVSDFLNCPLAGRGQISLDQTSLIAAANICDEDVAKLGGGTVKRYILGGSCTSDQAPREIIGQMLAGMAGSIGFRGNVARIHAGAARAAVVPAITEGDLIAPISGALRRSRSRLINSCKAFYADQDDNWRSRESPRFTSSAFQLEDGGIELPQDLRLGWVPVRAQATRLTKIELQRSRRQIAWDAVLDWSFARLEELDVIPVTLPRLGWSAKLFQVVKVDRTLTTGIGVSAVEYADADWAWSASEEDPPQPAAIIDPSATLDLPEPAGVTVTTESVADAIAGSVLVARVTWTAPDADLAATEVELRWRATERGTLDKKGALKLHEKSGRQPYGYTVTEAAQTAIVGAGVGTSTVGPLKAAYKYTVDLRFRSGSSVGPWLEPAVQHWVVPPTAAGEPPYEVAVKQIGTSDDVKVTWRYPAHRNVPFFEIWMSRRSQDVATAELIEPDATGRQARIEDMVAGNTWWWVRGRRNDGTTTPWGNPPAVFVPIVAKLGAVAKLDRIRTKDLEPDATAQGVDQEFVAKENIGAAFENLFPSAATLDLPIIDNRPEYPIDCHWEFRVPGDTQGTRLVIRLIRDDVVIVKEWEWNIQSNKPQYPSRRIAFKVPPGQRSFQLRVKAEGGPTTIRDGRLIVNARLS